MAGDALNDPNYAARLKLSEDPAKAKERAGMAGDYDVSGYSDKGISMAMKGSSFGDEDYARLTGNMPGNDDPDPVVEDTPEVTDPVQPETGGDITVNMPETKGPNPFIPAPSGGSGPGNIYQDNDQSSSVVGDNNTVTQNQDNSIGKFGSSGSWKDAWMKDYFA